MANGISRARLAIPRVNQNPQPPRLGNARPLAKKLAGNGGTTAPVQGHGISTQQGGHTYVPTAAQKQAAASQPSAALKYAAGGIAESNFAGVTAGGSTSAAAAATAPAPTPPSNSLFQIPSWTPASPGEADPRDSTYWANLAKLKFTDEQEYQKTLGEEAASNSGYNLALQQAIRGRGIQERELGENAIKGNLSASGWLNRNQAEQSTTYAEERGKAASGHEGELQAFAAARAALQQGFSLEAAQELAEAAGRRAELAGEETETGAPEVAASTGAGSRSSNANKKPVGASRWAKIIKENQPKKKGK